MSIVKESFIHSRKYSNRENTGANNEKCKYFGLKDSLGILVKKVNEKTTVYYIAGLLT